MDRTPSETPKPMETPKPVEIPTYRNIQYTRGIERAVLTMNGAKLTEMVPGESAEGSADQTTTETAVLKSFTRRILTPPGKNTPSPSQVPWPISVLYNDAR